MYVMYKHELHNVVTQDHCRDMCRVRDNTIKGGQNREVLLTIKEL